MYVFIHGGSNPISPCLLSIPRALFVDRFDLPLTALTSFCAFFSLRISGPSLIAQIRTGHANFVAYDVAVEGVREDTVGARMQAWVRTCVDVRCASRVHVYSVVSRPRSQPPLSK